MGILLMYPIETEDTRLIWQFSHGDCGVNTCMESSVFTCCSISMALSAPSFSSLSGDGKLRKEVTSGGRVGAGVDNYMGKGKEMSHTNCNPE